LLPAAGGTTLRVVPAALSGLSLCFASLPCGAQGEFPLEYRKAATVDDSAISMAVQWLHCNSKKPEQLKGLPEGVIGRLSYFVAYSAGQEILLAVEWGRPPRLLADTDRDGDLSDEQAIEGARVRGRSRWVWGASKMYRFGPFSLADPEAADAPPARVLAELWEYRYLVIYPSGYRTGTLGLGGKSYRMALVDNNLDGRYDGMVALPFFSHWGPTCDSLAIDLNNDGQFDYRYIGPAEIQPLTKLISVAGVYYDVEVVPDGSAIRLKKASPKLGTLDVGKANAELMLASDSGVHHLKGSEGKWQLPAGKYSAWAVVLSRTDGKQAKWTLKSLAGTGRLKNFEILAGETTKFKLGSPLTAKAAVDKRKHLFRTVISISPSLVGPSGVEYSVRLERNGKLVPGPSLKILDESGKVLDSGKFEYG